MFVNVFKPRRPEDGCGNCQSGATGGGLRFLCRLWKEPTAQLRQRFSHLKGPRECELRPQISQKEPPVECPVAGLWDECVIAFV